MSQSQIIVVQQSFSTKASRMENVQIPVQRPMSAPLSPISVESNMSIDVKSKHVSQTNEASTILSQDYVSENGALYGADSLTSNEGDNRNELASINGDIGINFGVDTSSNEAHDILDRNRSKRINEELSDGGSKGKYHRRSRSARQASSHTMKNSHDVEQDSSRTFYSDFSLSQQRQRPFSSTAAMPRTRQDGMSEKDCGHARGKTHFTSHARQRPASSCNSQPKPAPSRRDSATAHLNPVLSQWYTIRKEWSMEKNAFLVVAKPDHYRKVSTYFDCSPACGERATIEETVNSSYINLTLVGNGDNDTHADSTNGKNTSLGKVKSSITSIGEQKLKEVSANLPRAPKMDYRPFSAPVFQKNMQPCQRVAWYDMPQASRVICTSSANNDRIGSKKRLDTWRRHHLLLNKV